MATWKGLAGGALRLSNFSRVFLALRKRSHSDGRVLTMRIEVHTYLGLKVLPFCKEGPYGAGPAYPMCK